MLAAGEPEAIPSCRTDPRFARQVAASTGYVPGTMLVVPLHRRAAPFGIVQILRDGAAFGPSDLERGSAFVNLALATSTPMPGRRSPAGDDTSISYVPVAARRRPADQEMVAARGVGHTDELVGGGGAAEPRPVRPQQLGDRVERSCCPREPHL